MTLEDFEQSVATKRLPAGLDPAVEALWYDAAGDWDKAHQRAQAGPAVSGAWVHAYLHRKEGDSGNAAYWYRRAGQPVASGPLPAEWKQIAAELLRAPKQSVA